MTSDDPKKLARMVSRLKDEVEREVNDRLPRKVGIIAVQHFKQNFRDSGFRDGGLRPWKVGLPLRRYINGKPITTGTPVSTRRWRRIATAKVYKRGGNYKP